MHCIRYTRIYIWYNFILTKQLALYPSFQPDVDHSLIREIFTFFWLDATFLVTTPTFSDLNLAIPLMFRYESRFCLSNSLCIYIYIYIYVRIYIIYIYISIKTLLKPIKTIIFWCGSARLHYFHQLQWGAQSCIVETPPPSKFSRKLRCNLRRQKQ